ncbi:MAG: hypothetical protein QM657_04160 [Lacrimispora sp.]
MKSWTVFLIAIGFLLIAVSPQLPTSVLYRIVGLAAVTIGLLMLRKKK